MGRISVNAMLDRHLLKYWLKPDGREGLLIFHIANT